mgnify:CR=1 FL=1
MLQSLRMRQYRFRNQEAEPEEMQFSAGVAAANFRKFIYHRIR